MEQLPAHHINKQTNKSEIRPSDIGKIQYADMNKDDKWKIELIQEVLKLRFGQLDIEMFSDDELTDTMNVVCTS